MHSFLLSLSYVLHFYYLIKKQCKVSFFRHNYLHLYILLLLFLRFFESFWFVFVTQMNHIPMDIDSERELDWASSQLAATCNVESSFFNDWFTGHLNFQIEHQ